MYLFKSVGMLHYEPAKLILNIDREISRYYLSLIPRYIRVQPQKYVPHISVVRKEVLPNKDKWGAYEGESIEFSYEPCVYNDAIYYYLNVFCTRLEDIRVELGLPVSSEWTRPPSGFLKCFHTTIGNTKAL